MHWLVWQPMLCAGMLLSVAEIFMLVCYRILAEERMALLKLCLAISFSITCLSIRSADFSGPVSFCVELRRYIDIACASALTSGIGCFWIRPLKFDRNMIVHALTMDVFLLFGAASEMRVHRSPAEWFSADLMAYSGAAVCLVSWAVMIRASACSSVRP